MDMLQAYPFKAGPELGTGYWGQLALRAHCKYLGKLVIITTNYQAMTVTPL